MFRIYKYPFFIFFFWSSLIFAQDRATGLILDDDAYDQLSPVAIDISKYHDIPIQKSLKQYCPVPGDQGYLPSCVSWAIGYGAMTINKMIGLEIDDRKIATDMAQSASFIFNSIKNGANCYQDGMTITSVLQFLERSGDCLQNSFKNSPLSCQEMPSQKIQVEAEKFKLASYARLFNKDANTQEKIIKTQQAIAANNPVIIGMKVDPAFIELKEEKWTPDKTNATDNHALIVIGYNQVRKEFELMNSFGTNWGEDGFIKISFKDFGDLVRYACVISLRKDNFGFLANGQKGDIQKTYSAALDFRQLQLSNNTLDFVTKYPIFNAIQNYYELNQSVGDTYRLHVRKIPKNKHIYIFSLDSKAKIELHHYEHKTSRDNILIPNQNQALHFSSSGMEYIGMLVSDAAIKDIDTKLADIAQAESNFITALLTNLEISESQFSSTNYSPYLMQFINIIDNEQAQIIPLILKINIQ